MILVSFGDELCHGEQAPKLLAKQNGLNFIDKSSAKPTSNLELYKDIIKSSIEILEPEKYIFLIGWTKNDRITYRYDNKDIVFIKNHYNHENRQYDKLNKFNTYLFEPVMITQQRIALTHATQQTLEQKGIKYYMYNTSDRIDYHNICAVTLKNLNNKLFHNSLSYDSSMTGYIKKQGMNLEEGQEAWAKFLSQKMRAAGVLVK